MVAVLPARKVQAWLLSYWHNKINGIRIWLLSCRPEKSRHGCCPTGTIKKKKKKKKRDPDMVAVLPARKVQAWSLSYWHNKITGSGYGCYPAGPESPGMVVVLLAQ